MTVDAYDSIRRDVLARVERRRLRPEGDLDEVKLEVHQAVEGYQRRARRGDGLPLVAPATMADRILRSVTDLGPLTDLVARRDVEEIFIEGGRVSYLDGTGRLRGLTDPTSEAENRQLVDRLLATTERQLNTKHPMVQARVLDGTARLTAAIPPVGDCLSATLRRYVVRNVTLDDLVERESLSGEAAGFLRALMQLRSRVAVSGEPGAGKTTLAAALLAAAPPSHCVRSCEEIRELAVPVTHGSYYEVRPPALDGTGEISMRDLVKFVLAMRPDRIVVGEVRGAEAFELSRAVNAGCGFLCTVHANSAGEALDALVNAALMAGENVTERVVRKVFSGSLDVVVHVDRDDLVDEGERIRRRVTEIAAVVPALRDDFTIEPLFTREHMGAPLRWTGAVPARLERRMTRVLGGAPLRPVVAGERSSS
jgi:pilus assembly protein CpaF